MLGSGEMLFVEADMAYRRERLAQDFHRSSLQPGRSWVRRLGGVLGGSRQPAKPGPRPVAAPHH